MTAPRPVIRIGLVGFGWMGQAHSRSYLRIPTLFADRPFDTELVIVADSVPRRRDQAVRDFGYAGAVEDWRGVVEHPEVDVVAVTAPNMLHAEIVEAALAAGKHVFCEKPLGGTPEQSRRAADLAEKAGRITGIGYNFRQAPMVRYARQLLSEGRLGRITNYRGVFFSMYGADPAGLLSWRFLQDEAGYGATSDLLSHSVDMAHLLIGPIARVVADRDTVVTRRPLPTPGGGTHYERGVLDGPTGEVTNEDYVSALAVFDSGVRATFESARTIVGPESQMALEVYGTQGSVKWNFERMNELEVFLIDPDGHHGYTRMLSSDRYPYHGVFVPGAANGIGYEDLKTIEDYEFLSGVAAGEQRQPGFAEARAVAEVQDAIVRSWSSGAWEVTR